MLCSTLVVSAAVPGEIELPGSLNVEWLRDIPAQHEGRWQPLDTVARDYVETITGDVRFRGVDPIVTLLSWMFQPREWADEPFIVIGEKGLRKELTLPVEQTAFSFRTLTSNTRIQEVLHHLRQKPEGAKPDPLESSVSKINGTLFKFDDVLTGDALRIVPAPQERMNWQPIRAGGFDPHGHGMGMNTGSPPQVLDAWRNLRQAFLDRDNEAFILASQSLSETLNAMPAESRPSPRLIALELKYNRLRPFHLAWYVMAGGALFAALAMVVKRRWFDLVAMIPTVIGFALTSYGLWMRAEIADRTPAATFYESLLFLGWGTGAFSIVAILVIPHRLIPVVSAGLGALALMLADVTGMDSYLRPIAPALLDTYWMAIHVPTIMVSYGVLGLAALIAHFQIVFMAVRPKDAPTALWIDQLLYWFMMAGCFLLGTGIILGSMWAADSWGRYWGWDAKEVWSLAALLGFLAILHFRVDREKTPAWIYGIGCGLGLALLAIMLPKFAPLTTAHYLGVVTFVAAIVFFVVGRGVFATAAKTIIAFWLIVMTYVGVNFVLGIGLHSYGFGTGRVTRSMLMYGGIDLALIGGCAIAYLSRKEAGVLQPQSDPIAVAPVAG